MTRRFGEQLGFAACTLLISYALVLGATYDGILNVDFHPLTLQILGATVVGWLLLRFWRGWRWHPTAFDGVMLVWVAVFSLSAVFNPESWRRSAIALWYMAVYIGLWYLLHDLLANRAIRKAVLLDALLVAGLPIVGIGYWQFSNWVLTQQTFTGVGEWLLNMPRPQSVIGNPNQLAHLLLTLFFVVCGKWLAATQRVVRLSLVGYGLAILGLLLLTFSRGAWVSWPFGMAALVGLIALRRGWLNGQNLRARWRSLTSRQRAGVWGAGIALMLVVAVFAYVNWRLLNTGGRTLDLRTKLAEAAIQIGLRRPLFGYGLFTYGREFATLRSLPPYQEHSYAHSLLPHLFAELGVAGLAAFALMMFVSVRQMAALWRSSPAQQPLLMGVIAACVALAAHHIPDQPTMMPAMALVALLLLVYSTAPMPPPEAVQPRRERLQTGLLVALWLGVFVAALWDDGLNRRYIAVLRAVYDGADYRTSADRLQPIVEADPLMLVYRHQQGLLYGLAAAGGDAEAAQRGIAVYQSLNADEPHHALQWANLAGLYEALGDYPQALQHMRHAAELAPESWQLALNVAEYAAEVGDTETQAAAEAHLLALEPDAFFLEWFAGRELPFAVQRFSPLGQVVWWLRQKDVAQARAAAALIQPSATTTDYEIAYALLNIAEGQWQAAATLLEQAQQRFPTEAYSAWWRVGEARLAFAQGQTAAGQAALSAAQTAIQRQPLDGDWTLAWNFTHSQFWRLGIGRQFVPQVDYPLDSPILYDLIRSTTEG